VNRHHWPFFDPAKATGSEDEILKCFRIVRDEMRRVFEAYAAGCATEKMVAPASCGWCRASRPTRERETDRDGNWRWRLFRFMRRLDFTPRRAGRDARHDPPEAGATSKFLAGFNWQPARNCSASTVCAFALQFQNPQRIFSAGDHDSVFVAG